MRTPVRSAEYVTSEYELVSPLAFASGMAWRTSPLYCGAGNVSSLTWPFGYLRVFLITASSAYNSATAGSNCRSS